MATNQGFKSFVPDSEVMESKYLYHWLDANRRYLQSLGNGATFKEVSKKIISKVKIPLPPLDEQRRIAAILDKAEELRTKRREAIAKLDTLAQSIFIDMFGDPVTNPMGWETTTLREVASIERLTVIPKEIVTGTPYIGLEHIETGGRIIGTVRVNSGELKSSKFSFNSKHILYGKLRPYLCKIATPTVSGVCSTDILPILPGPKLTKSFLARYLRQPYWVDYATSLSVGANLPRLNPKSLEQFPVLLPNLEVQTRFSAAVDHLSQTGSRFANQLTNIDLAFSSLQQRAFKGEL